MAGIISSFKKYIYEDLGIQLEDIKSLKITSFPYFITDKYNLYRIRLSHKYCVLLISKDDQEVAPGTIKSHIQIVRDKFPEDVIFVQPTISSHNRKRLIKYKIPFIVPGNQMYLPELMIDLRDYFYSIRSDKNTFSPSTHAVILYILHHFREKPFHPSELTEKLGYSNTAMTRAFDEIKTANIGRHEIKGRKRCLMIHDKRQFWDNVTPYLKSPIRRSVWIRMLPEKLRKYLAGQTALSHYSILAPPSIKTFAAEKKDWEDYRSRDFIKEVTFKDDAEFELQIWNYAPKLFAKDGTVDRFSVYLSFKDNKDERIQSALEEMMESIEW